jgi:predicted Ser/Thr protein kinase
MSEQDRVGIGTFQRRDEKNQDSTVPTGDINYRKIALYDTDSDSQPSISTANGTSPTVVSSSSSKA